MAWKIGVEVSEELGDRELSVIQDDEELEQDTVHEMRWPLIDPLGRVEVQWREGADETRSRVFEASVNRIFKIAATGDRGRAVTGMVRGHHIVIASRALIRDEEISGAAPVAPESVAPEEAGAVAHHVLADGGTGRLVLRGNSGRRVEVRCSSTEAYRLSGYRIEDAHPTAGPLFGREPPHLAVEASSEPAQVVVGVEGPSATGRARRTATSFEELRSWLDDHQPGWFFARLYDANGDLLDSLDFRYAKGLEAIELEKQPPLPPPEGHCPAKVRFRLADGLTVRPVKGPAEITALPALPTDGFVLPARPDAGQAILRLDGERGAGIEVVVKVPRVWWAITLTGDNSPVWVDRPLTLSPNDFLPTSPRHLSLLLPEPGWADALVVRFADGSPRQVPISRTESRIDYPLRNLEGDEGLRRNSDSDLLISLATAATQHGPVTVGQLKLDRRAPTETERHRSLNLSALSCPRLMSSLTRIARSAPSPYRRAIHFLRETYYRPSRRGGQTEKSEFVLQGLTLLAALLERGIPLAVARYRRRQAEGIAAVEPGAVAKWELRLRRAETSSTWKDIGNIGGS